jgi:putative membrane protein insertion efficiency factor
MLTKILIALIRVYQKTLSRLLLAAFGPVCRFEPSCSRYAVACLEGHGAVRGTLLSVRRLCKCHPFHPGGYDPPPPPRIPGRATESQEQHRDQRVDRQVLPAGATSTIT